MPGDSSGWAPAKSELDEHHGTKTLGKPKGTKEGYFDISVTVKEGTGIKAVGMVPPSVNCRTGPDWQDNCKALRQDGKVVDGDSVRRDGPTFKVGDTLAIAPGSVPKTFDLFKMNREWTKEGQSGLSATWIHTFTDVPDDWQFGIGGGGTGPTNWTVTTRERVHD